MLDEGAAAASCEVRFQAAWVTEGHSGDLQKEPEVLTQSREPCRGENIA